MCPTNEKWAAGLRTLVVVVLLSLAGTAGAADRSFEFVVTCAGGAWSNSEIVKAPSLDGALKKLCPRDCGKFSRGSYPHEKCLDECVSAWRLGASFGDLYASSGGDCRYTVRQRGK